MVTGVRLCAAAGGQEDDSVLLRALPAKECKRKKRGFFNKVLLFIEGNRRADVKVHVFHELKSRFAFFTPQLNSLAYCGSGAVLQGEEVAG